jgi:hypothetical protein
MQINWLREPPATEVPIYNTIPSQFRKLEAGACCAQDRELLAGKNLHKSIVTETTCLLASFGVHWNAVL